MKSVLLEVLSKFLCLFPTRKIIVFESVPAFADNTKRVFDEMVRRNFNGKYKLIWAVDGDTKIPPEYEGIKNFIAVERNSLIYKFYYSYFACAFISGNKFLNKRRPSQYYIYLAHGCALKDAKGKHSIPKDCIECDVLTISDFMAKYDAENLSCPESNMRVLGYPRNDEFFCAKKADLSSIFNTGRESRFIYWLPTFRQHKNQKSYSSISMPILYDDKICAQINECAESRNVFIIVKPHPCQDISRIRAMKLSNLIFIDDAFLAANSTDNYQVLNSADALLTDYSSVYYDFLLADKPIGLCWDDFDEYSQKEGFRVDPHFIMSGGEKIYIPSDLKEFIKRIADNEDMLKNKRKEICSLVHKYKDGNSTSRTVDYIASKLQR